MRSTLKFACVIILIVVLVITAKSLTRRKVITQTNICMGTTARITIVVEHPSKKKINKAYFAIDQAFSLLEGYEKRFSFYAQDSELSQINKAAAIAPVKISAQMADILEKALKYSEITKGVFDITATSLQKEDAYGSIILNRHKDSVYFSDKKTKIDLGGIATGYVVDKIVERFEELQIKNYLIDVGGDIYAYGVNGRGKFWQVGVRNPQNPNKIIEKVSAENEAITTSGNYVKKHIIDTHNAKVASGDLLSVTVIAKTCIDADVFATGFLIMGQNKAKAFIMNKRNDIKAVFVVRDDNKPKAIRYNFDD